MTTTTLFRLHKTHIQEMIERGFTYVTLPSGEVRKVIPEDIIATKKEIDNYLTHQQKQAVAEGK